MKLELVALVLAIVTSTVAVDFQTLPERRRLHSPRRDQIDESKSSLHSTATSQAPEDPNDILEFERLMKSDGLHEYANVMHYGL